MSFELPEKRYIRMGYCNMCGDCCDNEGEDGGACQYLTEDRKCAVFGKEERYVRCPLFPESPYHPFRRCSYYFIDTYENKIIVPEDFDDSNLPKVERLNTRLE